MHTCKNQRLHINHNDSSNSKSNTNNIVNSTTSMKNQNNEVKFSKKRQNPINGVIKNGKIIKSIDEKEDAKEKWNILYFKLEKKIRKEMLLIKKIKRHIEILEKIEPSLAKNWLQYFINFIDNTDNNFYIIIDLKIEQLQSL
ncbi:23564_t:CDS:2 [Gigaspora margarita]|uniref:23564_t:CDS:1 n=1 Tax=Gigaspora margarita TaxID=4874 RepID=A0ABM8W0Q4_GIGMA|nr:23564_t:CDS:2 [Gigaspora margarita]